MSSATDRKKLALDMRVTARHLFEHALGEASIDRAFQRHLDCDKGVLRICEDLYDLESYNRVLVISIGKAAHAMVNSLEMQAGNRFQGIVASSVDPLSQVHGFRYFRGGHPLPNQESVRAAEAMLKSLNAQNASSLVIFLLSGGGSSIAEKPIDDEISLDDLIATYRALVHSGAPIAEINTIRKHLSAVKGGRLAVAASSAQQVSLLVSDVPDNTPDALASGPTMPDSTTVADCYSVAEKYGMLEQFPDSVRELFQRHALEETPKPDDLAFHRSRWWPLLSNASLIDAAEAEAQRHGFSVEIDNSCDDWDYMRAADYLLERLRASAPEVRARLPAFRWRGNRESGKWRRRRPQPAICLGLCDARFLARTITVLSAGTDGIDGNSPAAGAIVDGSTLERAQARGLDPGCTPGGVQCLSIFRVAG